MIQRKLHVLKIEDDYYDCCICGSKTSELRLNDRDFRCGDLIHFTDVNGYEFPYSALDNYDALICFVITNITPITKVIKETPDTKDYVMLSIKRA